MPIKTRSFPMYVFLNCLTLGIYGFIVSHRMGQDINTICNGDNEAPKFSYPSAVAIRGVAGLLGMIVGMISALNTSSMLGGSLFDLDFLWGLQSVSSMKFAAVLINMALSGAIFSIIGNTFSEIYLKYWWYKQAYRLKLNGTRYGLEIKESGTDNFLARTLFQVILLPVSILLYALALLIPGLLFYLLFTSASSVGVIVFASIIFFIAVAIVTFFGAELTAGSNFAMFFMIKNINRFAELPGRGADPFDPMMYEYYPSHESEYPGFLPKIISGEGLAAASARGGNVMNEAIRSELGETEGVTSMHPNYAIMGLLKGIRGSCAGYEFDLISGEEIVIGKDAKVSQVVIDTAYKEISRKHVGVCYDVSRDQYRITDYSSNGTWANGHKLVNGQPVYLPRNTELKLANDKNTFILG